jgi:dTDP-4-amino-4,6-dideoxygalactose transaminase
MNVRENTEWNYSYIQILLESEKRVESLQENLKNEQIAIRRYFYPSLNTINYLQKTEMPISESISKRILCLPLYMGISKVDIETITDQI